MIEFRLATLDDSQTLLDWRNHPDTRQFSMSSKEIPLIQHEQWLSEKLQSHHCRLFMIMKDEDKAGMIRLDRDEDGIIVSWNVAPEKRGMGIGQAMLEKLTRQSADILTAKILSNNIPSIKIAEKANFKVTDDKGEWLIYRYWPQTEKCDRFGLKDHLEIYNQSSSELYCFHYFE